MSVPATFLSIVQTADSFSVQRWLEIEGIPYGYGNVTKDTGWFAARAAIQKLLGVRAYFKKTPDSFDAEVDVMDGMAKFMGQVEFSIVDILAEQTLWAGSWDNTYTRELATALTLTGTSIVYAGADMNTTKFPLGGGTLYIGNETITYTLHTLATNTFSGCVRGMYRSTAQAWKVGAIISHKPYVMYGRRVWYYQTVTATSSGGFAAPTDADKLLRFSGTVENYALDSEDPGAYVLTCLSLEKELTREVFRDLRPIKDIGQRGIVGLDFTKPGIRFFGEPGSNSPTTADRLYGADIHQLDEDGSPYFTNGDYFFFKVGSEIILFLSNTTSGCFVMTARSQMGTTVEEHTPGFSMQEIAICARLITGSGIYEHTRTKFTSAPNTTSMAAGDHPLIVLLCVMLSTGLGTNNDGGRNYDVLKKAWGLGISYDRVDVRGIVALANDTPDLVLNGFWDKSIPFATFAKQCLAPFGFYGLTQLGDVWTVRRLVPPLPDQTTRTLTSADFISKQKPTWDGNLLGLVQEVEYLYNHDVKFNTWTRNTVFVNALGKQYAQGRGRRLKYELPQLYEKGPTRIPGRPPLGGMPNVELMLQERLEFLRQGFTLPPPIITRRFDYGCLDIEPGDLIKLTDIMLPRIQDGTRGIAQQTMRVLRKTIDEGSKTVELSLQDCGFGIGDFGYIAPSASGTKTGAATLVLSINDFTDPTHATGVAQSDCLPIDINGAAYDWVQDLINKTGNVALVSQNFLEYAVVAVLDWNVGTRTLILTAAVPAWWADGDYIVPQKNNTTVISTLADRYFTFLSDADEDLQSIRLAFRYYP